jgi:ferredoxin
MAQKVNPDLAKDLARFGAKDLMTCFNCGNCTAVCPMSEGGTVFPRKIVRYAQVGLEDRLKGSLEPWLCYYCGECSATCPRNAEPGETMMAARRWLTAAYDWTGLGRKFYTSLGWEIGSILVVGALVALGFILFHGPVVTDHVALNTFAPVPVIHGLDTLMAAGLTFFLLTNLYRMHRWVMGGDAPVKAPFSLYVTEAWRLGRHFLTQERFNKCGDNRPRWINHLLLVSGYMLMMVMIVLFLPWFQTDNIYPITNPQRWLGYYATLAILYGTGAVMIGRVLKNSQIHRFSHLSDWIFPILLALGAITGILIHAFRYWDLPMATYVIYVIHMALMVPMLVLEVPFGKWAHMAYRPFAIYLQAVKEKAAEQKVVAADTVPAA